MGWLDSNGLLRVWENIRAALAGKQDKLTGTAGQVVGFDADGEPVAQSTASLVGPQGEPGPKGDKGDTGATGPQGSAGPAGADGKSAYQYAAEGGYTGTEAAFKALMADAVTKAYVDGLMNELKHYIRGVSDKIACLVLPTNNSVETRSYLKLELFIASNMDYSLTYSGTVPNNVDGKIVLEPPAGYAFTGLAATWQPGLKIGTSYRSGTLGADGAITFTLEVKDLGQQFTFVSLANNSAPARFILEVA